MPYPIWKEMTEEQKLSFLNEWCANLSRAVEELRGTVRELTDRVVRAESQAVKAPTHES